MSALLLTQTLVVVSRIVLTLWDPISAIANQDLFLSMGLVLVSVFVCLFVCLSI